MPATKPPTWAKNATPAWPDRERQHAADGLQREPDDQQDPGRHLEHRQTMMSGMTLSTRCRGNSTR